MCADWVANNCVWFSLFTNSEHLVPFYYWTNFCCHRDFSFLIFFLLQIYFVNNCEMIHRSLIGMNFVIQWILKQNDGIAWKILGIYWQMNKVRTMIINLILKRNLDKLSSFPHIVLWFVQFESRPSG